MDKTPSRKDSASAFQDRTPLRKDFASEFQLDKETTTTCPCDTTTTAYTFCYSWFHSRARWVIHEASHEVIDTL